MKKHFLIPLLIFSMLLALCGCGKTDLTAAQVSGDYTNTNDTDDTGKTDIGGTESLAVEVEQKKETGYPTGRMEIDLSENEILSSAACANGMIYVACMSMDDSSYLSGTRICRLNTDGTLEELLATDGDAYVSTFVPSDDGSVWYLTEQEVWTVPDDPASVSSDIHLVHVSADGTELCSVSAEEFGSEGIGTLLPGPNGGLYVASDNGLHVLDAVGTLVGTVIISAGFLSQPFRLNDGTLMVWHWIDFENNDGELLRLNADDMTFESVSGVKEFTFNNILGGTIERLWMQDSKGDFVLYDPMTQETVTAITWADLGIDQYGVNSFCLLDENTVVLTARRDRNSYTDMTSDLYVIRSGYSLNSEDKITLTMAGIGISDTGRKLATAFNMSNDAYYVEITDYYDYDSVLSENNELSERFLYEINTGVLPDILVFSDTHDGISVDALARKGYLTDLGALIDADDTLSRSDFLSNVLDAVSIDGTLYTVPLEYVILTAAAATQITGGGTGCTLDDLQEWIAAYPDYGVMCEAGREKILSYLLRANAHSFIADNGSAALDAAMLREILEFVGSLPDTIPTFDTGVFSGGNIMVPMELWQADNSGFAEGRLGGIDYSQIGIPCADGNGQVVLPYRELAIASNTENPEGCWAFICYALSSDFQQKIATGQADIWELPLRVDALETGEVNMAHMYSLDASNPAFDALIRSANKVYRSNSLEGGIIDIIEEEAELAFSGQKSLDSAVSSIQSRASIYIAEQG